MREWITAYFLWLGNGVKGFTTGVIAWTRSQVVDRINDFTAWEDWSKGTVDWWLSWAPWPISILTDWFGGILKDSLITPTFTVARWPFHYIRDRIDSLWDRNVYDYTPSLTIGMAFVQTGDGLLSVYDALTGYADAVGAVAHNALVAAGVSLWNDVNALWASLQSWQDWIVGTLYPMFTSLGDTVQVVRQDVDDARGELYAITRDPAGWVWRSVYPVLSENVRLWLLDIW